MSRGVRNRYRIGTNVLVYYISGLACQVYIGDKGVQYFNPETLNLDLQILPKPNWPAFSIISAIPQFNQALYRQLPELPQHNPEDAAERVLSFSINQILTGAVNVLDLCSKP